MIAEKIEKLKNQEISAGENVQIYLDRIREKDPYVNAFIDVYPEHALKSAREIDNKIKEKKVGRLSGLVIGVKSNINVKDYRITCASKTLENYISPYDAEVIKRIKAEDGIIIGMANMDEFACGSSGETGYLGPTKNPIVPDYICGGSSSGPAAAVAADFCDLALGSDTGGSIRNPASHCGIVGVKPTYGLVPREGLIDLAMSLDQIGPLSKDVFGSALLLKIIAGYNPKECTSIKVDIPDYTDDMENEIDGLTFGVCEQFEKVTDPRINKVVSQAIDKLLQNYDVKTVNIELPYVEKALVAYYPLVFVEFFSATRKFDGRRYGYKIEEVCNEEVGRRIHLGSYISQKEVIGKYYKKALQTRGIIKEAYKDAFKKCDIILTTTVPKLPHELGTSIAPLEMYAYDLLTIPPNLAGICAGVVPAGEVNEIPVGLQVQANKLEESRMFRVMRAWEKIKNGD